MRPVRVLIDRIPSDCGRRLVSWVVPPIAADVPLDVDAMVATLLPGLGHLLSGRRRAALAFAVPWFLGLAAWWVFMPTVGSGIAFGLAAGVHVAAIGDAGGLRRCYLDFGSRLRAMLNILVLVGLAYAPAAVWVARHRWFAVSWTDLPSHGVRARDVLLCRRLRAGDPRPGRGDLCIVQFRERVTFGAGNAYYVVPAGRHLGIWLAGPGEQVTLGQAEGVLVGGRPAIPPEALPPEARRTMFPAQKLEVAVPPGRELVLLPIGAHLQLGRDALLRELYSRTFMIAADDVVAQPRAVQFPLSRRQWIRRATAVGVLESAD